MGTTESWEFWRLWRTSANIAAMPIVNVASPILMLPTLAAPTLETPDPVPGFTGWQSCNHDSSVTSHRTTVPFLTAFKDIVTMTGQTDRVLTCGTPQPPRPASLRGGRAEGGGTTATCDERGTPVHDRTQLGCLPMHREQNGDVRVLTTLLYMQVPFARIRAAICGVSDYM